MYVLIFRGRLKPGYSRDEAARALAPLFQTSPKTVENKLFIGRPVRVKEVTTKAEAQRLVDTFARAGAELEMRTEISAPGRAAARGAGRSMAGRVRRGPILAAVVIAILVILAGAAAWYTLPIWQQGDTSELQADGARALATPDLAALAHLDVARAAALESRIYGSPDPDALPGPGGDLVTSLVRSGLEPRNDLEDLLVAVYPSERGIDTAWLLQGRVDASALRAWLDERYQVQERRSDGTVVFAWQDLETCQLVAPYAARPLDGQVLIAPVARIDELAERVGSGPEPAVDLARWHELTRQQVATGMLFAADPLKRVGDGMAGLLLAGMAKALEPAELVYGGVRPRLMPPGVGLTLGLDSDEAEFLDKAYDGLDEALTQAREQAADWPELQALYERVAIDRDADHLTGSVRLDTDFDDDLANLVQTALSAAFGTSPDGRDSGEEQLEDNPLRFVERADPGMLKAFGEDDGAPFEAQWQGGPFGAQIARARLGDDGRPELTVKAAARGLVNAGSTGELVTLRIREVRNSSGESLLGQPECGPDPNRQSQALDRVTSESSADGEGARRYRRAQGEKTLQLIDGAALDDISAIEGELTYQLPTRVKTFRLEQPLDGKAAEHGGVRVLLLPSEDNGIATRISGETRRLLMLRALNAEGEVLQGAGRFWGPSFFSPGQSRSKQYHGEVASAEVVIAEELEPVTESFVLDSGYPPAGQGPRLPPPVPGVLSDAALQQAMAHEPPDVEFSFGEPETTLTVGPALIGINNVRVSDMFGIRLRGTVYLPDALPLAGQLAAIEVALDRAVLADGSEVALNGTDVLAPEHAGAQWINGEYREDSDEPWLEQNLSLQDADYDGGAIDTLHGRLTLNLPEAEASDTMSAGLGSKRSVAGTTLTVTALEPGELTLRLDGEPYRLLAVLARNASGQRIDSGARLSSDEDERTLKLDVAGRPAELEVIYATQMQRREQVFSFQPQ